MQAMSRLMNVQLTEIRLTSTMWTTETMTAVS